MNPTATVIRWTLSHPVLTHRLRIIADEGLWHPDPYQELTCTVTDLLNPRRTPLWRDILRATGAGEPAADAVWAALTAGSGPAWMNAVDWRLVRLVLLGTESLKES